MPPRSPPLPSVVAASDCIHHGAPGDLGAALERLGGAAVVVDVPVIHEPDVLVVLPLVGHRPQALLEELDGVVGPSGPMRIGLGQEDGAEPIRDVEPRIERGRDVEQRVQEIEGDRRLGGEGRRRFERVRESILGVFRPPAVVLNRPYPVQIRRQRTLREHDAPRRPLRQVERFLVARLERKASVPQRLQPRPPRQTARTRRPARTRSAPGGVRVI